MQLMLKLSQLKLGLLSSTRNWAQKAMHKNEFTNYNEVVPMCLGVGKACESSYFHASMTIGADIAQVLFSSHAVEVFCV